MKKLSLLFLIVFLGGLFFPLVSLAGGIYQVEYCTWIDKNHNGIFDNDDELTDDCVPKDVYYQGLVPCGKSEPAPARYDDKGNLIEQADDDEVTMHCQFCHFFVMIDGILDFLFVFIVPPIAALMLVVGGIMFYFAGGNPQLMTQARNLIKYAVIGLVVIYGAYLIVGTVLTVVEVQEWTTLNKWLSEGAFNINCPIELPSP